MLTIAIPKGRLFKKIKELLIYFEPKVKDFDESSRKLIFETNKFRLVLVKPFDVPTYVYYGGADLGICGKDVILEHDYDIYELLDLNFGKCRISIAQKKEVKEFKLFPGFKVATKYENITRKYFGDLGIDVEIIKLYGSVELAPILNLADAIVDLVETGTTLRENGLKEVKVIEHSSARLIANRAFLKTKYNFIKPFVENLKKLIKEKKEG